MQAQEDIPATLVMLVSRASDEEIDREEEQDLDLLEEVLKHSCSRLLQT